MSWRQYGGTNRQILSTINAGSIVANQFLSRSTAANTNQFDNLKVKGQLISQDFIQSGTYIQATSSIISSGDMIVYDKLYFGTDASNVPLPWSYIYGDSYGISINNTKPQAVFHLTGLSYEVLKIDTSLNRIRNIIGQNVNAHGIVIAADDSSSNIYFYNDVSTNVLNTPDSYIKNEKNKGFSISSANSLISLDNKGNLLLDASGALILHSKSGGFNISASTQLNSFLVVSNRGTDYSSLYNESAVIYDYSNAVYLHNVYDLSSVRTGNGLSILSIDNSSNAFLRIIDPSGGGFSIGGGAFPEDTTRSFGTIMLSDTSGSYILSQNIVSGKNNLKYVSTTGINTFSPKTERYVLDVNGPTRIGNGEIKTVFNSVFEFKKIGFSKVNSNFGMAIGSASSTGLIQQNGPIEVVTYPQYFSYTIDKGIHWNVLPIDISPYDNFVKRSNNTFKSIFVYDTSFSIIGTNDSSLFWTTNGGASWNQLGYVDNDPLHRNTTSIYVRPYNNRFRIFLSYNYDDSSIVGLPLYNTMFFDFNPYDSTNIIVADGYINYLTTNTTNNIQNTFSLNYDATIITSTGPNNYSYRVNATDSTGRFIYLVGDGIIKIDGSISTPTTIYKRKNSYNLIYNAVFAYNDDYVIAVGNNIISWTNRGSTDSTGSSWVDIRLSTTNIGNVILESIYIYDLYRAVAVGNDGVFVFSANWQNSVWSIVSDSLLNSSGISKRINGVNNQLIDIRMLDIDSFLISNVTQEYIPNTYNGTTVTSYGKQGDSRIIYAYYPNIYNRKNNTVFELSGNMVMSGDINVNDGGEIISNNNTFYILENFVETIYTGYDASKIFIGSTGTINSMTGSLFVGNDLSVNSRLYVVHDACMNSRLFVSSDTSLNGNLYSYGRTILQGDVSMNSRLFVNGDVSMNSRLFVAGDISMGSRLFLRGDASMNSRLFVSGDVSMGSRLFVNGDASMNSRLFVSGDVSMGSRLFVNGDVSMNSRLFVSGDVSMGSRLFVNGDVSMNSRLFVSGDVSMGSRLFVSGDVSMGSRLFVSGDVSMGSRLFVNGDASMNSRLFVSGDVSMGSRLFVNGDASMNSRLFVSGDVSMGSRLFVNGDVSMNSRLFVSGDVSMGSRLFVNGDVSMNSRLFVSGDVSMGSRLFINGDASMNSRLFVSGDVSMGSRLFVNGDASMNSRLFVSGDVSMGSRLFVNGDVSMNSRLFVAGDVSMGSRLFVNGDASMNSRLFISGDVSMGSRLFVNGDVSMNSRLFVAGDVSMGSRLFINGDVSMNSRLFVTGDVSMGSRLFINGDVSMNGNMYALGKTVLDGDVSMNSRLFVGQDVIINGRLNVLEYTQQNVIYTNITTTNYTLIIAEDLSLNGRLNVDYDVSMNSRLFVSSDVSFNGNMYTSGISIQQGDVSMNSRLFINGDVSMNSRLFISSDVSMNARLFVSSDVSLNGNMYTLGKTILQGDVSMNSRLFINGDVSMNSRLFVSSDVSMNARLFVSSDVSFNGNMYTFGRSIQQGDVSMNSRLFINGDVSLNSRLFVSSDVSMNARLFVSSDVSLNRNMYTFGRSIQQGDVSMNSRLFISGDVSMNSRLFVSSDVSMNARLFVSSDVSLNGNMYTLGKTILQGDVSMNSRLFIIGAVSMNSRLFVSNDVSFGNDLYINNNVTVNGSLSVKGASSQEGDFSITNRLFVGKDSSINGNVYIGGTTIQNKDVSMNGRLFVSQDVSLNKNLYVAGNITSLDTIYGTNYDICANLLTNNPYGTNTIRKGDHASTIIIGGSSGLMTNRRIAFGSGLTPGSTTINDIYLGGPTDNLIISGGFSVQNFTLSTIAIPTFILNSTQNNYIGTPLATNYGSSYSTINNVEVNNISQIMDNTSYAGAGLAITDGSHSAAGFLTVNTDGTGYIFKGPFSSNMVELYCDGLKYPYYTNFGNQSKINNGIMVLTKERNITTYADTYSISVKPIDISNILLKDETVDDLSFQRILTSVGIVADLSLNSRLFVNGDVSMNSRLFVTGDVSMGSRLFINGDVSMNSRLFVIGDISMNSRLFVGGDVSMNGNTYIGGDAGLTINNSMSMNGIINQLIDAPMVGNTVYMGSNVPNDSFIGGRLYVYNDTNLYNRLFVSNDVFMNGNIYLSSGHNVFYDSTQLTSGGSGNELFTTNSGTTSPYTLNYLNGTTFYITSPPSSNFTCNLTNLPSDINRTYVITLIITATSNKTFCDSFQINGNTAITPYYANGIPTSITSGNVITQSISIQRISVGDIATNVNVLSAVTPWY